MKHCKNKKSLFKIMSITAVSVLLIAGVLAGCGRKGGPEAAEAKEAANTLFTAFAEQDADTLDRILPNTGLGSFVYNDPEGFKLYTSKMSWEIIDCEEGTDGVNVRMKITNADMVKILKENPPLAGAQMPDPTPEQMEAAGTVVLDYTLPLKKSENGYQMDVDSSNPEASMEKISELLNVITGGGYQYLASLMDEELPDEEQ